MSETTIPKGYWEAADGTLTPESKIKPIDKARDKTVRTMVGQAKQMAATIAQFRAASLGAIEGFVEQSAAEYDAKLGGKKGNVQLISYDGRYKVVRAIQETLAFDERLQVAQALIGERIHEWSKGSNANIKVLVNQAFQVDKQGKVSTSRVLALRQLNIDDAKWCQAMEAISDSIKTVSSKAYIRFYERDDSTGEYVAIALDVSAA